MASVEVLEINGDYVSSLQAPSLLYHRREPMAAVMDDYIFVFGGTDEQDLPVKQIEMCQRNDVTSIRDEETVIHSCQLQQNFPNPFNASTTISFDISKDVTVRLEIYTVTGQLIKTILDKELTAGSYRFVWNGDDNDNSPVASGVYLYQLKINDSIMTKKLVMIR
jgi:hypothetical protein